MRATRLLWWRQSFISNKKPILHYENYTCCSDDWSKQIFGRIGNPCKYRKCLKNASAPYKIYMIFYEAVAQFCTVLVTSTLVFRAYIYKMANKIICIKNKNMYKAISRRFYAIFFFKFHFIVAHFKWSWNNSLK